MNAETTGPGHTPAGDWPGGHGDGAYRCRCVDCGREFNGDKLRVLCFDCATRRAAALVADSARSDDRKTEGRKS